MAASAVTLAALFFTLLVAPSYAIWIRMDGIGGEGGTSHIGVSALDFGIYHGRYGIGLGTAAYELRRGRWDVDRPGQSGAAGRVWDVILPVKAYVALRSWEGEPFLSQDNRQAHATVGRIELYGAYSDWAKLRDFDVLSAPGQRVEVNGSVPGRLLDAGIRLDIGSWFAFSVGRVELQTRARGPFAARPAETEWYAKIRLYAGATIGETVGGRIGLLPRDAWANLRRLIRRPSIDDIVTEEEEFD